MNNESRKWVARGVQIALVVLALAFVGNWLRARLMVHNDLHLAAVVPPPDSLGPGDLRIFNSDSTVDVILTGDRILAGLSPKMVAKVRTQLDSGNKTDTGLGGSIATMVKKTVAGAINTHAAFSLAAVKDVRFDNGRMVVDWVDGSQHDLFGHTNVNGRQEQNSFRAEDVQRFSAAVSARKKALGQP
ncbi:MAG TPA: hypothetical protein VNE60_05800 [Gemmatimonadaceae bacterium]|nr:hypothetical protein [Gemmatimonadaceae bacterium]